MDVSTAVNRLRHGNPVEWPETSNTAGFAEELDRDSELVNLRNEFTVPTQAQLERKRLDEDEVTQRGDSTQSAIYFCGNSLGLQPKAVSKYLNAYLNTWGSIAVNAHFTEVQESPLVPFQDMAAECATKSASIFGALPEEIVVMNSLTVNLHLMMAAFYRPTEKKNKIMLEWRPFPSDYVWPTLRFGR